MPLRDGRALRLAAERGDLAKVDAEIKSGANPNDVGSGSWTALHRATQRGHVDIVRALIAAGADVHAKTQRGLYTPLHVACREGCVDLVRDLLLRGSNPRAMDASGMSCISLTLQGQTASRR